MPTFALLVSNRNRTSNSRCSRG